ncbi:MAG: hypothetical protein ACR2H3_16935 [Acidimicrobiales bacterium]
MLVTHLGGVGDDSAQLFDEASGVECGQVGVEEFLVTGDRRGLPVGVPVGQVGQRLLRLDRRGGDARPNSAWICSSVGGPSGPGMSKGWGWW